jgi:hypothetical protein
MPASPEQIAANRENSARSTGPKTPEGKARSRRNALKHGLTGAGVALPSEDSARIEERFQDIEAEFRPTRRFSQALAYRIAFLMTRLERCMRFDRAHYSGLVRAARAKFDDARKARVEELADDLDSRCATASRRLQEMPEGIDWLLSQWAILRDDLTNPDGHNWGPNHLGRTRLLRGIAPSTLRASREYTIAEVVSGFFSNVADLKSPEVEALDDKAKIEWARLELLQLVDAEIARLKEAQAKINLATIAEEREESVDRALFDASKEMILARKYEAATERAIDKALNQFDQVEMTMHECADYDATEEPGIVRDELASFGNPPDPVDEPEEPEEKAEPEVEFEAPKAVEKVVRTPEERKKRPDPRRSKRR